MLSFLSGIRPNAIIRRPRAVAAASLTVAVVVGFLAAVFLSDPLRDSVYDLDEASVWVVNTDLDKIGRANAQIAQLDTVIDASDPEVVQDGRDVFVLVDNGRAMAKLDPAGAAIGREQTIGQPQPDVDLAGGVLAITDVPTGKVQVAPVGEWESVTTSKPVFELGTRPDDKRGEKDLVAVGSDGTVAGLHTDGSVRVRNGDGSLVTYELRGSSAPVRDAEVAVVSGRPVVLDRDGLRLLSADREPVSLAEYGAEPRLGLQGRGESIIVATSSRLLSIGVDGAIAVLDDWPGSSAPVRPMVVAGRRALHRALRPAERWADSGA
jgi:hypothetical protein